MEKFLLAALCVTSAIYAGPFITWNGADDDAPDQIQTGLDNGTGTSGFWFTYTDYGDGGQSIVHWDIDINPEPPFTLEPIIYECKGICGTARLSKGTSAYNPFVGLGFNVAGEISEKDWSLATGDASTWGGLCVTYTSDTDIALELGLGEKIDSTMNYANPAVTLPASQTDKRVVVSWSDFKQPSWYNGSVKFDGETAAKQLVGVHFKIQAEPGEYEFRICAVGPKDGTCPEKCGIPSSEVGIKSVRTVSAPKAILNGRMLGFTGIKTYATVEVMNSLGQVVMKGAINNASDNAATRNLSALDAGIYMVRVNGKNVNFAKKIVLR